MIAALAAAACESDTPSAPASPAQPTPPPPAPPPPEPPPAPTGLHVSGRTSDSITWTWNAVEGATGYSVQVSLDQTFDDTLVGNPETVLFGDEGRKVPLTTETAYTASGLDPETTLYVRVAAAAGTHDRPVLSVWTAPTVGMSEIPLRVSFAEETVAVREGDTVEIGIRWEAPDLANPLELEASPLGMTAEADDYELPTNTVTVPAGGATTGAATLSLTAVSDRQIAEGDEMLALRLVPPAGVAAELGRNLEVTIVDAGASPCFGVQMVATRVESLDAAPAWRRTTLEFTRGAEAGAVWFDWGGPYLHDENCDDEGCRMRWEERTPILEVNLVEWRMESSERKKDILKVEWFGSKALRFGFHSRDGACEGQPTVVCTAAGCELDNRP